MGGPIPITRRDFTAADLRAAATRINNGAVVRRLLALALLLEGASREVAAVSHGERGVAVQQCRGEPADRDLVPGCHPILPS